MKLLIPVDAMITDAFDFDAKKLGATKYTGVNESIPDGWEGVDIGAATIEKYKAEIAKAKTIIWNGPMGVFEFDKFAAGTNAVAQTLAECTAKGAITIIVEAVTPRMNGKTRNPVTMNTMSSFWVRVSSDDFIIPPR